MEKLIFKTSIYGKTVVERLKMSKMRGFRTTEKAEKVIASIMKEKQLNLTEAIIYAIEAFQLEPVDSSSSPFSLSSTVWLLCFQQDKLVKFFVHCPTCSENVRRTCRPFQLLKKILEQTP